MPQLHEVHQRIQQNKAERRELNKIFKDEVRNHARHTELVEQIQTLKEEKKGIEDEIHANALGDAQKLDELRIEIQTDIELISDIALNMYVNKEPVEIVDENDQKWTPVFVVKFEKS